MAVVEEMEVEEVEDTRAVRMNSVPFNAFSPIHSPAKKRQQKDPAAIARRYQLTLCQKAKEENVIVYLETGCGKTLIAVLLMKEFADVIRKPGKHVCVFLAPTVPLVEQQAKVIECSSDFKVGRYYGEAKHSSKAHQEWMEELEKYEVFVMTPEILLHNLHHCFMKMELIELLIFDECHHAQKRHPYAQIMKEFFRKESGKRPRIFGMTASPIIGKGGTNQLEYAKGINSLEQLLDAKVYTVMDRSELESFVPSPIMKICYYNHIKNSGNGSIASCRQKLEQCRDKHISLVFSCCNGENTEMCCHDFKGNLKKTKTIAKVYGNLLHCLDELGLRGAKQAIKILSNEDRSKLVDCIKAKSYAMENHVSDPFLRDAFSILESSFVEDEIAENTLEEPFLSSKAIALVEILLHYRDRKDMKCIVFVKRIITARLLAWILNHLQLLQFWRCEYLVGFHSGLKDMSRAKMNEILDKFRSGKVNLLVTTNVAEEGLDIQTCCLVVRFDFPSTVASFIQSRGRARMPESHYIFLVERDNFFQERLVKHFIGGEEHMRREVQDRTPECGDSYEDEEDQIYKVDITQATVSTGCSVSLLHHYCSKLSGDEYFIPTPEFFYFEEPGGVVCRINLPSNAPIRQVDSPPCPSNAKAKRLACLEACKLLHSIGALTDYLLPGEDDEDGENEIACSPDWCKVGGDHTQMEVYEMLVPVALQGGWTKATAPVSLHAYLLNFIPNPPDREYTQFALFLESGLPGEAENMKVDLHLARGRIVIMELVPLGIMEFNPVQIRDAVKFQEVFLGIMLDRSKFLHDYVPLESEDEKSWSSSTMYLLLPLKPHNGKEEAVVDWKIVKDCLSSPILFPAAKESSEAAVTGNLHEREDYLLLADGWVHVETLRNSLVVTNYNRTFYCIVDIHYELNANSKFSKSEEQSYAEYYEKKNIFLQHKDQPLLKAKQLLRMHNLLHERSQVNPADGAFFEEYFVELPPELCSLKLIGFSSPLASSISLLPSTMHRLENLLVAIELKDLLTSGFPEGSQITASRVLEALTTERCMERFSLERLEVLGDAFLKYAVSRHLFLVHAKLDEGQLTKKRSNTVKNSYLYKRAKRKGIQAYIRDEYFDPKQYFALGRPCKEVCSPEKMNTIHCQLEGDVVTAKVDAMSVKCTKRHHWLHMKTIADVVEALIGAYLVDSGFKAALAFLNWIGIEIDFEPSLIAEACKLSTNNLSLIESINIVGLEKSIGHEFKHKGLLLEAFTHPSYNEHNGSCYQRLEFLGDAVLDYIITSYLYSVYPDLNPGQLTDMRAMTVNNESFARIAVRRRLHHYLIKKSDSLTLAVTKYVNFMQSSFNIDKDSRDELAPKCPKALGDIVESLAGALLVDTGFNLECVWELMLEFLNPIITPENLRLHPVRELTELCQHHHLKLDLSKETEKNAFVIVATVTGKHWSEVGVGMMPNIKAAKKVAAQDALPKLKDRGLEHSNKILEIVLATCGQKKAVLVGFDERQASTQEILMTEQFEALGFNSSGASGSLAFDRISSTCIDTHETDCEFTTTMPPLEKNVFPENDLDLLHPASILEQGMSSNIQNEQKQEYLPSLTSAAQISSDEGKHTNTSDEGKHTNTHQDCVTLTNIASESRWLSASSAIGEDQMLQSARSRLYEFCAKRNWESPNFCCSKEEGVPHEKRFTYMAILRLPGGISVECLGQPMKNKKSAMESAAHGTLWWLKSVGYL